MFLYHCRYVQLIDIRSDGVDNLVGSMVLVFQLSTWAYHSLVLAVHPYEVSRSEDWYVSPVGICPLCLAYLDVLYLDSGYLVNKLQSFCCSLCLTVFLSIYSDVQLEIVTGVETRIGEER